MHEIVARDILKVLPYFVYNGGSAGCADCHGHYSPGDSNCCYNKHLRNTAHTKINYMTDA